MTTENKFNLKPHIFYLVLIIFIASITYYPFFNPSNSYPYGDWRVVHQNTINLLSHSIHENNALPFWEPQLGSGEPLFALPDKPFFYPITLFMLTFLSPVATLNFSVILHVILAGVATYFLAYHLLKNKEAALLSALLFMLSPGMRSPPFYSQGLAWIPLMTLFLILSFSSKNWSIYAILTGMTAALQLLAGGYLQIYYTFLFILMPFLLYKFIIAKNKKKAFFKIAIISLILLLVLAGFGLIRVLPYLDWVQHTNRSDGLSIQQAMGSILAKHNFFFELNYIGLTGCILAMVGFLTIFKKKNKYPIFFSLILLLNLLFAAGIGYSFLYKIVPGLSSTHHLKRSLFIFVFAGSIMAGYGFLYLINFLKKRFSSFNSSKTRQNIFFIFIFIILLVDMISFSLISDRFPTMEPYDLAIKDNEMVNYMATQEGYFRYSSYDVRGIDWNDMDVATIPLGLNTIYNALTSTWYPDYFQGFLSLAYVSDYAKIMGILNVKYITSAQELNISGLEYVNKFNEFPEAWPDFADGPYLYENKKMLPRSFISEHNILVVGEESSKKQIIPAILVSPFFNTSTTVVINSPKQSINGLSLGFLKNFDAVVLVKGSIDQDSSFLLKQYIEEGGILLPNVIEGQNNLEIEDFEIFTSFKEPLNELEILDYGQNSMAVNLKNQSGIATLSERFAHFEGWNIEIDGKKTDLYKSNGAITSFIIPSNAEEAILTYKPQSIQISLSLFFITLIIVMIYFIYYFIGNKKMKGKK